MARLVGLVIGLALALTLSVRPGAAIVLYLNGPPPPGTEGVITTVSNGAVAASIGAAGVMQLSNGTGGFAVYGGSSCAGQVMTGLSPTGNAFCTPFLANLASPVWLSQANTIEFPNGVNLGAAGSGLLKQVVSGGVAAPFTVAAPIGAIVGTTDQQRLSQKLVDPVPISLPTNVTPLTFDISTFTLAVASELLQDTLIANPTGSAVTGQEITLQVHSTVPRLITWDTLWSGTPGTALPTNTTGGAVDDIWKFQFNARTGKWTIVFNSQLQIPAPTSGIVAGTYTCPSSITFNMQGLATAAVSGSCVSGGGGATPAGLAGDVQLSGGTTLAADSGNFLHDTASHMTATENLQVASEGANVLEMNDAAGHVVRITPQGTMTTDRGIQWPDEDGTLCVKGGSCFGGAGLGDASTNTSTSVDSEVALFSGTSGKLLKRATGTGIARLNSGVQSASELSGDATTSGSNLVTVSRINGGTVAGTTGNLVKFGAGNTFVDGGPSGGGGNVSNTGTPLAGQVAEWTNATTIQGVSVTGTGGSYVKSTSPTLLTPVLTSPNITKIVNLSTNGVVTTTGSDGTLVVATNYPTTTSTDTLTNKRLPPRVSTLTSAATNPSFQCDFGASEQCEIQATGTTGNLTVQAPLGTMQNGEMRMILLLCTNAQTFVWDAMFIASPNVPLPASCPAGTSTWFGVGTRWSSVLNKFQILASN